MRFGTILCDPPWEYEYWGGGNGVPGRPDKRQGLARDRYETHGIEWLKALAVADVAEKHAVLILWATWPLVPEAVDLMRAWGFKHRTGMPWLKMARAACPRVGLGYHLRSCSELLLIGARGSPGCPVPAERPLGAMFCPPAEHSRKPDLQYELAELYPRPWLELFSRRRREGWENVGDHLDGLDIRESLRRLAADEPLPRLPVTQPALDWQAQP